MVVIKKQDKIETLQHVASIRNDLATQMEGSLKLFTMIGERIDELNKEMDILKVKHNELMLCIEQINDKPK